MSNNQKRRISAVLQIIKDEGLEIAEVHQTKHFRIRVKRSDGETKMLTAAVSSSDWREPLNIRARARRFAQGATTPRSKP